MCKLFAAVIIVALACFGTAVPAFAHAHLKHAVPPVGSTVSPGPTILKLSFSEGIELAFSKVEIAMDDGMTVQPASVALDPNDPTVIIVTFSTPLDPGQYAVTWHVVSVDTHKTQGHYTFSVKP